MANVPIKAYSTSCSKIHKFFYNRINWKQIRDFELKIFLEHSDYDLNEKYLKDFRFYALGIKEIESVPKNLVYKYLKLNKIVLTHLEEKKKSLLNQLAELDEEKSLNFLKKMQIESSLQSIIISVELTKKMYDFNSELVSECLSKSDFKNIEKMEKIELKTCEKCKKVFKNSQFYEKHKTKNHSPEKRPSTSMSTKIESLSESLIEDFKQFAETQIKKVSDINESYLEIYKNFQRDQSTTSQIKKYKEECSEYISEPNSFKDETLFDRKLFKIEFQNEVLKQQNHFLDTQIENLKKKSIQRSLKNSTIFIYNKKNSSSSSPFRPKTQKLKTDEFKIFKENGQAIQIERKLLNPPITEQLIKKRPQSDKEKRKSVDVRSLNVSEIPMEYNELQDNSLVTLFEADKRQFSRLFSPQKPLRRVKEICASVKMLFKPKDIRNFPKTVQEISLFPISKTEFERKRSILKSKLDSSLGLIEINPLRLEWVFETYSKFFQLSYPNITSKLLYESDLLLQSLYLN